MKVKSIPEITLKTTKGKIPILPNYVEIELEHDIIAPFPIRWNNVTASCFETEGIVTVKGELYQRIYPNPFIKQRADPFLYEHTDGYYYFTGSHPLYDRIVLRRATSIDSLPDAEEVTIWTKHDAGIMSEHIWAPELHHIDGKWYIYFAAGDKDDVWAIRPYVLENTEANPLEGNWIEKGQINTAFQSFSLDATTFEHDHKRYLVWAQKVNNDTVSNLYIAEMENPWTIKEQILLSTPDQSWEQQGFHVNEGPAVIKDGDNLYIAYSASATDDRYAMGLLSANKASDLLKPDSWTKSLEPVFVSCEETSEYGPGHNSFCIDEEGFDIFIYHARPYKKIKGNPLYDHNRHARIQRLFWKNDGAPYFGYPGERVALSNKSVTAKVKVVD